MASNKLLLYESGIEPIAKTPELYNGADIIKSRKYANINEFQEPAKNFIRHGKFCLERYGSKNYSDWWYVQRQRCYYGHSVGGMWISGIHYFYLNFIPMKRRPNALYLDVHPGTPRNRKVITFPDFWEVDYHWFLTKELAKQNAERGIQEAHIVCLKSRRTGFSYKESAEGAWNFAFIEGSETFFTAYSESFLLRGGIFTKAVKMLEFINTHTEFRREIKVGEDNKFEKGSKYGETKLIARTLDNINKVRGIDGYKVVFEEGGSYPDLLEGWEMARAACEDGADITGHMTLFGTGGGYNDNIELSADGMAAMEEIFNNPRPYGCIPFPSHLFGENIGNECGFFVSAWQKMQGRFGDENGNIDKEKAIAHIMEERAIRSKSKNPEKVKSENPLTPSEALIRPQFGEMPVALLRTQYDWLRLQDRESYMRKGYFRKERNGDIVFDQNDELISYDKYPIPSNSDEKPGCIVIWEEPHRKNNKVPGDIGDIYYVYLDPVDKDDYQKTNSVFAAYVYKRDSQPYTKTSNDKIVASFVGRWKKRAKYYKQLFYLLRYYNAKLQSESGGGGMGVLDYAGRPSVDMKHYCEFETTIDSRKEWENQRNRSYFMNMTDGRKREAIAYLIEWLLRERGISNHPRAKNGRLLNLHTIYDEGLLLELINFRDKGNFDRVSAMLVMAFMEVELSLDIVEEDEPDPDGFFEREIFQLNKKEKDPVDKNGFYWHRNSEGKYIQDLDHRDPTESNEGISYIGEW